MALPCGTTARQLATLARWTWGAMIVTGMFGWWWPSYIGWGAAAAGLLATLLLWLMAETQSGQRHVWGHGVYLCLLGPCVILIAHFLATGLGHTSRSSLSGSMEASMLLTLGMLAGGIMLTQSLLGQVAGRVWLLAVCGAAMVAGPLAAMAWGDVQTRHALSLLGYSGLSVYLSSLFAKGPGGAAPLATPLQFGLAVPALPAAGLLIWSCPSSLLPACAVGGAVLTISGVVFVQRRRVLLVIGAAMLAAAIAVGSLVRLGMANVQLRWALPLGRGEAALDRLEASDSGLAFIAGMTGWVGTLWLVGGLCLVVAVMLVRARRGRAGVLRSAGWAAAAGLAASALLGSGGLFIPAVTLATAFTMGLLPTMLGWQPPQRRGVWLLVAVLALALVIAVANIAGLAGWSAVALGGDDFMMHMLAGAVVGMVAVWLAGGRRLAWGLAGLGAAILLGLAGEVAQKLVSRRMFEMRDWLAHSLGCLMVLGVYLLAWCSRWAESPDCQRQAGLRE